MHSFKFPSPSLLTGYEVEQTATDMLPIGDSVVASHANLINMRAMTSLTLPFANAMFANTVAAPWIGARLQSRSAQQDEKNARKQRPPAHAKKSILKTLLK